MKITIFCVLITLVLSSCTQQSQDNPQYKNASAKYYIEEFDKLTIEIDSLTPYYSNCIQYFDDSTSKIGPTLITYNAPRSTIDFYSLQSKNLVSRINLYEKKIGNAAAYDGFFYINDDSIFLTSSTKNKFMQIDSNGIVANNWDVTPSDSNKYFCSPTITTANPMVRQRDQLYLSGFLGPAIDPFKEIQETQIDNLNLKMNLASTAFKINQAYPSCYFGKLWGGNMLMFYRTYNDKTRMHVYSFPANHNIVVTDLENRSAEYPSGSSFFNEIFSMDKDELSAEQRRMYYLKTPSYGPVIYDTYRDVYYRIAYQAISEDDLESNDLKLSTIKQVSIIILDKNFTVIGETILPRFSFTETMFFVTSRGLHLGKWEESKLDDTKLVFGIFKLIKNENSNI